MRVSIFKIISLCLILFIIVIFFVALNIDKRYSTENIVGKKIDNFKIKFLFSDEVFKKEDLLNGEHYLINIWASWCLPCKKEHPILMKLSEEENLNLIGWETNDIYQNLLEEGFCDPSLFNNYGVICKDKELIEKAIGLFNESISKFPEYAYSYFNLGIYLSIITSMSFGTD